MGTGFLDLVVGIDFSDLGTGAGFWNFVAGTDFLGCGVSVGLDVPYGGIANRFSSWCPDIFSNMLQSGAKNIGKIVKLRKSCYHKQNIDRIYNEQLQCSCLQQLQTEN